jgi:hypothetical protein
LIHGCPILCFGVLQSSLYYRLSERMSPAPYSLILFIGELLGP